jgi:hypothetical protein
VKPEFKSRCNYCGRDSYVFVYHLRDEDFERIREIVREEIKAAMLTMWGSRP